MMSEDEKKDYLDSARLAQLRHDFEVLRLNSQPRDPKNLDLDAYLLFLKDFGRTFPQAARRDLMTGGRFLL